MIDYTNYFSSPAVRGRGLKLTDASDRRQQSSVARRARAWIETTWYDETSTPAETSPAVRGRGLKPKLMDQIEVLDRSPAVRGRGLKLLTASTQPSFGRSPAVRGRGLKRESKRRYKREHRRPPCAGVD